MIQTVQGEKCGWYIKELEWMKDMLHQIFTRDRGPFAPSLLLTLELSNAQQPLCTAAGLITDKSWRETQTLLFQHTVIHKK